MSLLKLWIATIKSFVWFGDDLQQTQGLKKNTTKTDLKWENGHFSAPETNIKKYFDFLNN